MQHFMFAGIYTSVTKTCEQVPSCRNMYAGQHVRFQQQPSSIIKTAKQDQTIAIWSYFFYSFSRNLEHAGYHLHHGAAQNKKIGPNHCHLFLFFLICSRHLEHIRVMAPPMKVYSTSLPLPARQRLDRCLNALSSN